MTVRILELYPQQLNLNGDTGNRTALARRLQLAGVDVAQAVYDPGDDIPADADIVLTGTGTSSAVRSIAPDLARIAPTLKSWSQGGTVFLAAGAGFHLLARTTTMGSGETIDGAGIFDATVDATAPRTITEGFGIDTQFGTLIGTENHTAFVSLGTDARPLGTVLRGRGNGNGTDGAVVGNSFGTHLHGPALVLNPAFADRLIELACDRSGDVYRRNAEHDALDRVADLARGILMKKLSAG